MSIFGGSRERHGHYLREVEISVDDAMLRFDAGWDTFSVPDDITLAGMTTSDIAEHVGLDPALLNKAVAHSLAAWRISPSRSFINVLGNVGAGAQVFPNMRQQSAALFSAAGGGILNDHRDGDMRALRGDDRKRIMVSNDAPAVTLVAEAHARFNAIARGLATYEARTGALVRTGRVKGPKALYRGLRGNHMPALEAGSIDKDAPYEIRSCRRTGLQLAMLLERPLAETCDTSIVSCTSNRTIAEYFTKSEGFVVEIDPSDVGLVAGWATDEELDGKDPVSRKHEREWIVRLPRDLVPRRDQVCIHDRTWSMAMVDPAGIAMLEHYDHAQFDLEGRHVTASWVYNSSGTGGALHFTVSDAGRSRYGTRAEIKRQTDFDPVPGPERSAAVSGLRYYYADPFLSASRKDYMVLEEADFLDLPSGAPGRHI